MKPWSRSFLFVVLVLAALAPAFAEEPPPTEETAEKAAAEPVAEEESDKPGRIFAEAALWWTTPSGQDLSPASYLNDEGFVDLLQLPFGSEPRGRYRVGYLLKNNIGEFTLTWWSHNTAIERFQAQPTEFVFGETQVVPFYAGVYEDAQADAYAAEARSKSRDLRIDFARIAFSSPRVTARWYVGYRQLTHVLDSDASYYALAPSLPPVLEPIFSPDDAALLAPRPDAATSHSKFRGNGTEAGLELEIPIAKKVWIETGVGLALVRGTIDTTYSSVTHFYGLLDSNENFDYVIYPPFDEFEAQEGGLSLASRIRQFDAYLNLRSRESASTQALDAYFGFRWKAWRAMELFAGLRSTRYDDIVSEVRPASVTPISISVFGRTVLLNAQDFRRINRSVGYEGYYVGLSYAY